MGGLFGDAEVAVLMAPEADLARMVAVEAAYVRALGRAGVVAPDLGEAAALAIEAAKIDPGNLRAGAARDGLVVPNLVRQLKEQVGEDLQDAVHRGLTSQDVMDTALVLGLREVLGVFEARIGQLILALEELSSAHGARVLTGRTRMQTAVEITVGDRVNTWAMPLSAHLDRLVELRPRLLRLQFGGAAGTRDALGEAGEKIAVELAAALDLGNAPRAWHAMRDGLGELASWLSLVSGTLGKMGQDIVLMAQQGVDEIALTGGGGSSAMPHKANPVKAELLVTLARFNAVQLGGMHQALVHEQERSGAAWVLEWMILPEMVAATGCGLAGGRDVVGAIERIGNGTR